MVTQVQYGLASRPSNPTCLAPDRPVVVPTGSYSLEPLFPNLSTGANGLYGSTSPITIKRVRVPTATPDPSNPGKVLPGGYVWVLALRNGRISVITDTTIATLPTTDFRASDGNYDYTQSEGGFLSMAFDPDFATDPARNQVYYVRANWGGVDLWRATVDTTTMTITGTPVKILSASGSSHHYGGDLQFGPDNFLYFSVGEGDTGNRARGARNLRGKILRIDVHSTTFTYYGIPADNPYAASATACSETSNDAPDKAYDCPEIYARGFRNPFRMSFDRVGGALWVGDVGSQYEEINIVERGGDYGWNDQEGPTAGSSGASVQAAAVPRSGCEHSGYAIIGGYVYRGTAIPSLEGKYLAADNGAGKIFVLEDPYNTANPAREAVAIFNGNCADTNFAPASFAEDENGELYVVSLNSAAGQGVFKIVPMTTETAPDGGMGPPQLLSATGCFEPGVPTTAIAGAIPFDVNAELWSDGLIKRRWMALPDNTTITVESDGDWTLPIGTVLIKEFRSATKLLETRLLVRHDDGDWAGYTYVWNAAQTDATLAQGGSMIAPGDNGAMWSVPSRAQCLSCHTSGKGRSLGLETRQLNKTTIYPGALAANQLRTLAHIGLIPSSYEDADSQPKFAPLDDTTTPVDQRLKAYLHSNCSHCHPGPGAKPDLEFDTAWTNTHLCNETPTSAVPGGTHLFIPGNAAQSILSLRMKNLGSYRMPRLGSARVDTRVMPLLDDWINGLSACP
jgi:uncharacterized repeat protein (TIGR03806 family)